MYESNFIRIINYVEAKWALIDFSSIPIPYDNWIWWGFVVMAYIDSKFSCLMLITGTILFWPLT